MRFLNKYDEALAHLVLAGSDIMLCPSFDDTVLQIPVSGFRKILSFAIFFGLMSKYEKHSLLIKREKKRLQCTMGV